jgi:hypothetical protein
LHKQRTCATRPFQISAFLAKPHGDRPSLKFQRRSANCVVVLLVIVVVDSRATGDAGLTKADADDRQDTTARRVNSKRFIIIIIKRCSFEVRFVPSCESRVHSLEWRGWGDVFGWLTTPIWPTHTVLRIYPDQVDRGPTSFDILYCSRLKFHVPVQVVRAVVTCAPVPGLLDETGAGLAAGLQTRTPITWYYKYL